ncbi:hypothetical protein HRI_001242200 [Hibiscus trionum]|uniref:Alpha-glucan water dikinase-like N-terminal Ig-like domain-containing protein n=1 Tax=Hibiscus trionum TaxID=183268 RepID=A0A9W7HDZ5_HIBTR|nr:hypothetical protein HRI_001242200 [Hibiscus trionum]
MKKPSEDDEFHEVRIDFNPSSAVEAIHFVLRDEETGAWYQHKGRDFKVPLADYLEGGYFHIRKVCEVPVD